MRLPPLDQVVLTDLEIEKALEAPRDFGYSGDNEEMFETWALGPVIRTRDSDLAEESNAAALEKTLEEYEKKGLIEKNSYEISGARHWAVGWVDHLSYQVIDDDGEPTNTARFVKAWFDYLRAVYPLADEDDYSEREYDATIENIAEEGRNVVRDDAPEDWPSQVFSWLWDNNQGAVENTDGHGAYPRENEIREAAEALGFAEEEEDY